LTKSTAFAEIEWLLQSLTERSSTAFAEIEWVLQSLTERSTDQLKTVYVDDCCKFRRGVLGQNVSVKLDLFHAVQRITKNHF